MNDPRKLSAEELKAAHQERMKAEITAIAPWFGGKRTLAPKIVQQLGKHTQYFEPFVVRWLCCLRRNRARKKLSTIFTRT